MDKPTTMSVKEYLTRILSIRTNTPLKIIDAVVNHQLNGLNEAIQSDIIFTAELSGFGKFIFNHKKAKKKMDKNLSKEKLFSETLETPGLDDKRIASIKLKLENTRKFIKGLKPKLEKCPSLQNI